MRILKKIVRGLAAYGLRASLFGFALFLALAITFGTPGVLKDSLRTSGLYDAPLTSLLNLEQMQEESSREDFSIDNPEIKDAIEETFSAERKQEITEQIIDGTHVWLVGDADAPDFQISFSKDRQELSNTIAEKAFKRVDSLPACTPQQTLALQEFDPFTLPCKPPIDLAEEKKKFIEQLNSNDQIFGDATFDGKEILNEFKRRDTAGAADTIPTVFQWFTRLPVIMVIFALISGLIVFFLADSRRKGVKKIGKLLVETAISLVISGLILYYILGGVRTSLGAQNNTQVNEAISSLINSLRDSVAGPWLVATVTYLLVGVFILVLVHRKTKSTPQTNSTEKGIVNDPATD